MPKGFYREVIRELTKLGYVRIAGGKGSHEKWKQGQSGRVTTVPHNLLSRHTANAILKGAGSSKRL